jgi:nicotinamide mononucleotide transporter
VEGINSLSTILFSAWGYGVSTLEFAAALTSFIGVGLGVTAKRITWPWWALSSALYAIFFYEADLFASAALQIVFIAAAVWGWFGWGPQGAAPSALSTRDRTYWAIGLVISFLVLTPLLQNVGAAATWSDAIIFLGSFFAQAIMVYEKYEAWPLWFAIDLIGTVQYAVLGYWFTAFLYLAFTAIALVGWKRWYESHRSAH